MVTRSRLSLLLSVVILVGAGLLLSGFLLKEPTPANYSTNGAEKIEPQYLQEAPEKLTPKTMCLHRAIQSLVEELQAVDWYQQRVDAAQDESLKKILAHNRDEEKEHAAMLIEWLRRNDEQFAKTLKEYLFTDKEITHK